MKIFKAAILLLLLIIVVQFLNYTGLMPEWAKNLEPLAVRSNRSYYDGFKIKISSNERINDEIYIILNGRKKGLLSEEQTLNINKGDVLEIDATRSSRTYFIKLVPVEKYAMPSNWPESIILDKYLYRFPAAKELSE